MTILAQNLDKTKFDTTATVLAGTPTADQESTSKYLELIGVDKIDKQFNDTVKKYEQQYKLESLELQQQSNIGLQDTLMQAGEAVGASLGTGAMADFAQDIGNIQARESQAQQTELTQQFTDAISDVQDVYSKWLSETFGELTDSGYANLSEYEQMVDEVTTGLLAMVADNTGIQYSDRASMIKGLQEAGLIESTGVGTEMTLTDEGLFQFESILINPSKEFGSENIIQRTNDLIAKMADNYMAQTYPSLDIDSSEYERKHAQAEEKYNLWLQENMTSAYYTHLDLARFNSDNVFEVKGVDYGIPDAPQLEPGISGTIDSGESIRAQNVDEKWFGEYFDSGKEGTKQYKYIWSIINDIKSGTMPVGSYFVANYGAAKDSPTLFYYDGDYIYKTEYDIKHLPKEFAASQLYGLKSAGYDANGEKWFKAIAAGQYANGQQVEIFGQHFTVKYDTSNNEYILIKERSTQMLGNSAGSSSGGGGGAR